jgi:hypothetical protein
MLPNGLGPSSVQCALLNFRIGLLEQRSRMERLGSGLAAARLPLSLIGLCRQLYCSAVPLVHTNV